MEIQTVRSNGPQMRHSTDALGNATFLRKSHHTLHDLSPSASAAHLLQPAEDEVNFTTPFAPLMLESTSCPENCLYFLFL